MSSMRSGVKKGLALDVTFRMSLYSTGSTQFRWTWMISSRTRTWKTNSDFVIQIVANWSPKNTQKQQHTTTSCSSVHFLSLEQSAFVQNQKLERHAPPSSTVKFFAKNTQIRGASNKRRSACWSALLQLNFLLTTLVISSGSAFLQLAKTSFGFFFLKPGGNSLSAVNRLNWVGCLSPRLSRSEPTRDHNNKYRK